MDLDDIKGILGDVGEDKVTALTEMFKSHTDSEVKGLKAKLDELLNEAKTAKSRAEELEAANKAAELESMKKTGDIKAIEERIRQEANADIEKLKAALAEKDNRILGAAKRTAASRISAMATNEDTSKALSRLIDGMIEAEFDDKGDVSLTFRDLSGEAIATSEDKFIEHIKGAGAFAPLIKSGAGTGSGAAGGSGGAQAKKQSSEYETHELVAMRTQDPEGYKRVIADRQKAYKAKVGIN